MGKKKESIPDNIARGMGENVPKGCAAIVIGVIALALLAWMGGLV